MDLDTITSEQILAIPVSQPERLFSSLANVAAEYKSIAKILHPDKPTGNKLAFQHLQELYTVAERKVKIGEWLTPNLLILNGEDGKSRRIKFMKEFSIGVGNAYLGKSLVTYILPADLADLAEHAHQVISGFDNTKYPSDRIKDDIEKRRPKLLKFFKTIDGKSVLVINKDQNAIRLKDVVDYFGGRIDPKHVAWIMSELYNLSCWMEISNITHNDLSMDSLFILPENHSVMILGGWWFSAPEGAKMQRIQLARTIRNAPTTVINTKQASIKTDLTLIRLLGCELLGDGNGTHLTPDTPAALSHWLRIATTGGAREDYKLWQDVLTASFGKKRVFTELVVRSTDIYKEE